MLLFDEIYQKQWLKNLTIIIYYSSSLLFFNSINAQNLTRKEYIKKFAPLAVQQMQTHRIPASITLAQGILESNNGNSRLAVKGNNHFGIKCHGWEGKKFMKMMIKSRNVLEIIKVF